MLTKGEIQKLKQTAENLVAPGKGILAADESFPTIEKRFAKINIPSTEENRQAYRQMLFTTTGAGEFISGVILFDETIRQSTRDGRPFVKVLEEQGIIPGIKVDQGTESMPQSPEEKVTKGLEGLADRLAEYAKLGAQFTKWRAVITIGQGIPTAECIAENARRLAKFAKLSQEAGLVPIVEPEVLMDGAHDIKRCEEVTLETLRVVYEELAKEEVALEGTLLKPNMVISGKESAVKPSGQEIAQTTIRTLQNIVPPQVPGIVFLSGGQSEIEATVNLNEMNKMGRQAWELSFSYGRALQDSALKTWAGKAENVAAAQAKFYHRAKMNSLARFGHYSEATENQDAAERS